MIPLYLPLALMTAWACTRGSTTDASHHFPCVSPASCIGEEEGLHGETKTYRNLCTVAQV